MRGSGVVVYMFLSTGGLLTTCLAAPSGSNTRCCPTGNTLRHRQSPQTHTTKLSYVQNTQDSENGASSFAEAVVYNESSSIRVAVSIKSATQR